MNNGPLRVGVGGPVGSGKTALVEALCRAFGPSSTSPSSPTTSTRARTPSFWPAGALPLERIVGVETGGCPHSAIREDASVNLAAVADLEQQVSRARTSSSSSRAATTWRRRSRRSWPTAPSTSSTWPRATRFPRKGGPGITRSDLLVINKIDLAPARRRRPRTWSATANACAATRPFIFISLRAGDGVDEVARFIEQKGGLE